MRKVILETLEIILTLAAAALYVGGCLAWAIIAALLLME